MIRVETNRCFDCGGKETPEQTKRIEKHCLGLNCPERKSICCGAGCEAVSGDEGTGHYQCKKCHGEFIGGKCTAGDIIPPNADTTMTYPLLEKAPQPHTSWQFLDFICKNNEIVYENNEWVVIKNCKYNGAGKPLWLTAFHKGNLDSQAIMDLWSLWCGGDFEKWEWLIKARSKQTVKRFHIHLIQK